MLYRTVVVAPVAHVRITAVYAGQSQVLLQSLMRRLAREPLPVQR